MIATSWPSFPPPTQSHAFAPSRPSPLSPRSANACPRPQFWTRHNPFSSMSSNSSRSSGSENDVPFAKRDIKSNPVIKRSRQTPDEARERRREMFMRKVESGREEGRWKGRSEQILRSDYLAQRRRWEQDRTREAHFFDIPEDDVFEPDAPETPRLGPQPDDAAEVDEIAQMEEEELRALLEMQEQEQEQAEARQQAMERDDHIPSSPSRYGSDDEDYDDIFMELLSSQQMVQGQAVQQQDAEMMDTT